MSSFNFKGVKIPIRITYKQAMFDFKDMGLNILNLFKDETIIMTIMSDDETMLQVWYSYVKKHASSFESAVEDLTPEDMHQFKDAFWEAVVNFTAPAMRPILQSMMEQVKEALASPEKSLSKRSSESLDEQE